MAFLDPVIFFTGRHQLLAGFYRKGLDLHDPEPFGEDHLSIQLEGAYMGFDRVEGSSEPSTGGVSPWFGVSDLDARIGKLVQMGAEVRYPTDEKPFGDRLASVYDADGNIISFVQSD